MRNFRITKSNFADGCLGLVGMGALFLIALLWLWQNHPNLIVYALGAWATYVVAKWAFKKVSNKRRENKYKALVQQAVAKWKNWETAGLPTITDENIYLEEAEVLHFVAPFNLKVGASNRVTPGKVALTNKKLIFSSKTSTKKIGYEEIFTLSAESSFLYVTPKKGEKNLCLFPLTEKEEVNRLLSADVYVAWAVLTGQKYQKAEPVALQILGVQKQNRNV